jgi:hypothetical protein
MMMRSSGGLPQHLLTGGIRQSVQWLFAAASALIAFACSRLGPSFHHPHH